MISDNLFLHSFVMSRPHGNRTPEKGALGTPEKGEFYLKRVSLCNNLRISYCLIAERFSYYVVWNGRNPGIYDSWNECSKQVFGFKNASFKGFHSLDDANAAFSGTENNPLSSVRFNIFFL